MVELVVFDVDGTMANCDHRLHHIRPDKMKGQKKNFRAWEEGQDDDTPIPQICNIYKRFVNDPDVIVIVLTGRNESTRYQTAAWLERHELGGYDELILKPKPSHIPDTKFKEDVLDRIIREYGKAPDMVFEDRKRVIDMWRRRGVFVVDVAQVAEEF